MIARILLLAGSCFAALAASADAGTLYGISNGFGTPANNTVYQINPATGAISNVFPVTIAGATVNNSQCLVANPMTGVLWGVIQTTPGGRRLVTIDPTTGVATAIGALSNQISYLAFKADGTLLAVSGDGGTPAETLYTVNTTTAALTVLFALGNGLDGEVIAMHPNGLMYHSSGNATAVFETVNLTTQATTFLGNGTAECFALGWSNTLGQMYLSDIASDLYTVNLTNGARTLIGNIPSADDNRGLAFVEGTPFTAECPGDTAALCPCSGAGGSGIPNPGAAGFGCANSSFPAGAQLVSSGSAVDNAGDSLVLTCTNMPGPGLFFQANANVAPVLNFNDGTLCAGSGIIRMGVVFPTGSTASYPGGLTPAPIHLAGAPVLTPTPTKHYQCWYRDITVGFCNTAGHNMSNGISIVWSP